MIYDPVTKSFLVLLYLFNNHSLVLVFLLDMANKTLFPLLSRYIAADYLKLKYATSKLQRTVFNIVFIKISLHHNLVPKFLKVQDQFVNNKDRTRAEESNVQNLSRNYEILQSS